MATVRGVVVDDVVEDELVGVVEDVVVVLLLLGLVVVLLLVGPVVVVLLELVVVELLEVGVIVVDELVVSTDDPWLELEEELLEATLEDWRDELLSTLEPREADELLITLRVEPDVTELEGTVKDVKADENGLELPLAREELAEIVVCPLLPVAMLPDVRASPSTEASATTPDSLPPQAAVDSPTNAATIADTRLTFFMKSFLQRDRVDLLWLIERWKTLPRREGVDDPSPRYGGLPDLLEGQRALPP